LKSFSFSGLCLPEVKDSTIFQKLRS